MTVLRQLLVGAAIAAVSCLCAAVAWGATIDCRGDGPDCDGTDKADTIVGSKQRDVVDAGAGNDSVTGKGDLDQLRGGDGRDRLVGGGGDEHPLAGIIDGGPGADRLLGKGGGDFLLGAQGDDVMLGGKGDDVFEAAGSESQQGRDRVTCGPGDDEADVNANDIVHPSCETVDVET